MRRLRKFAREVPAPAVSSKTAAPSNADGRRRTNGPPRNLELVDLVVWECPVHGVVDEWPDDGSPESRGATSPHFPVCPGPWDEDLNNWTYKCERKLRRKVHTD